MQADLICVDWGTSSFRAYLTASTGAVIDRIETARGILAIEPQGFEAYLAATTAAWRSEHGRVPIMLSGMIGSRQGWVEAPYLDCPAAASDVSRALVNVTAPSLGQVVLVPGLICETSSRPDVMRGEETQILGAMARSGASPASPHAPQVFVLPGTHAKWATVEAGAISRFSTYMTGEIFAALKGSTILGRLMTEGKPTGEGFRAGVSAGAEAGGPGSLLHRIFSARTLGLTDRLPASELSDYLSGVLIGAEIADASTAARRFTIIGVPALAERYEQAATLLGLTADRAPTDCVVAGQIQLARATGLIRSKP